MDPRGLIRGQVQQLVVFLTDIHQNHLQRGTGNHGEPVPRKRRTQREVENGGEVTALQLGTEDLAMYI